VGNGLRYQDESTIQFLKNVYNGENNDEVTTPRWWAEYPLASIGQNNVCGNAADGQYTVTQHTDGSVTAKVPMFTRAKEIVPATDFTGNNPFEAYMRVAYVKFTLYRTNDPYKTPVDFRDIENPDGPRVKERVVPIYQVRRINNPKAIWRKSGSTEPFHVKLMHRPDAASAGFSAVSSRGPWRAYILQDPNGIVTLTKDGKTVTGKMSMDENAEPTGKNMISGITDDPTIEFDYTPSGADGCAIIRVDYHDYTCHHLIFVRSGYEYGVKLGNANWSCYNAYAVDGRGLSDNADNVKVEVTKHPFSIGTSYKRNEYTNGILEKNSEKFGWLANIGQFETMSLNSSGARVPGTANWSNFQGYSWCSSDADAAHRWERATVSWASTWKPTDTSIGDLALPTYDDYYSLIDNENSASTNIEFGYGIAYTDGATEVATTLDNAYGFTDFDNDGNPDAGAIVDGQTKGMRVCIVYDKTNGNQIVLPIGSTGHGRRPRQVSDSGSEPYGSAPAGTQSYGAMRSVMTSEGNGKRPLTYNHYRNTGAVYWIRKPALRKPNLEDGDWCAAWDINYNNVVFNHYDYGTLWYRGNGTRSSSNSSDALPMRFIYKE
ncbi:MAG: hypothetical protein K2K72_08140, partial [Duncaniella sp.]|nr:hypothetical protein [Duncaniella sp.]